MTVSNQLGTDGTKTPRLDSNLSQELPMVKLSPTLHGYLLTICVVSALLAVLATLGNGHR